MKRCNATHRDKVHDWLRANHESAVEALLALYTKDATARMLRDYLYSKGITEADGVKLSRAQIRQALVPWKRYGGGEHVPYAVPLELEA